MAIKKCRECGNRVSSKAASCPSCGAPIKSKSSTVSSCLGCLFILVVGVPVGLILMAMLGDNKPRNQNQGRDTQQTDSAPAAEDDRITPEQVAAFRKVVAEIDGIQSVSADENWLRITVGNEWHYGPKQMRLQASQNLWKIWAGIHSPNEPDHARIKIQDLNGNEVGGSRVWGGSLIWVQD